MNQSEFRRQLKVAWVYIKIAWGKFIAYKFNFVLSYVTGVLYMVTFVLSIEFIMGRIPEIAGYGKRDLLIYLVISQLWWHTLVAFVRKNFQYLDKAINNGQLDWLIIKPVSIRTVLPYVEIGMRNLPQTITMWVVYLGMLIWYQIGAVDAALATMQLLIGLVITYFFHLTFVSLAFFYGRSRLAELFMVEAAEFNSKPWEVFTRPLQLVFTFVLPIMIVVYPTAETLISGFRIELLGMQLVVLVIFAVVSNLLFNIGLRSYTSAS